MTMQNNPGIRVLFGVMFAVAGLAARAQIFIEGNLDDWAGIPTFYTPPADSPAAEPLGRIKVLRVASDPDFLMAEIEFAEPRPFVNRARPQQLVPGVWEEFEYLELDTNQDGAWDFRTQMTTGKRPGINNLALLDSLPTGFPRQRVLFPEGSKNYMPLGPRACWNAQVDALEMRLPRGPLNLQQAGDVRLRLRLRYRDTRQGNTQWVTKYLPSGGAWLSFHLGKPLLPGEPADFTPGAVSLPAGDRNEAARPLKDPGLTRSIAKTQGRLRPDYELPSLQAPPPEPVYIKPTADEPDRLSTSSVPGSSRPPGVSSEYVGGLNASADPPDSSPTAVDLPRPEPDSISAEAESSTATASENSVQPSTESTPSLEPAQPEETSQPAQQPMTNEPSTRKLGAPGSKTKYDFDSLLEDVHSFVDEPASTEKKPRKPAAPAPAISPGQHDLTPSSQSSITPDSPEDHALKPTAGKLPAAASNAAPIQAPAPSHANLDALLGDVQSFVEESTPTANLALKPSLAPAPVSANAPISDPASPVDSAGSPPLNTSPETPRASVATDLSADQELKPTIGTLPSAAPGTVPVTTPAPTRENLDALLGDVPSFVDESAASQKKVVLQPPVEAKFGSPATPQAIGTPTPMPTSTPAPSVLG